MKSENSLLEIIRGGYIKPVYQPIASLRDGSILGYEALSRISLPGCEIEIEELFDLAPLHSGCGNWNDFAAHRP